VTIEDLGIRTAGARIVEGADIAAGTESSRTLTADRNKRHVRIDSPLPQGLIQPTGHLKGQRIQGLGAVQPDQPHLPAPFEQKIVGTHLKRRAAGGR
jgi:hypothetical protein